TVLYNNLGTIVWSRTSAGIYVGTLVAAFTSSKTGILISNGTTVATAVLTASRTSDDAIGIKSWQTTGTPALADDLISGAMIQIPYATLDIAHQLASDLNILTRTADYINAPDHADWKHLDNFAAARQQSFDMATGKYIFWCDTDDVLQAGAEVVRELAEKAEYDCYIFPYEIFGQHVSVPRERMVKHGSGRWTH